MIEEIERPDHLITPERAAKGDVDFSVNGRGLIDRAQVVGETWLYWLFECRIIDSFDLANGEWFRNMHEAYCNRQGICTSSTARDGESGSSLADDYVKLVMIVRPSVFRDIEKCCTEPFHKPHAAVMHLNRHRWRSAFGRLETAIGELKERKKAMEGKCQ